MYLLGILQFPTESYPCSSGFSMGSLTKAGGEIPKLFHVQHMLLWQEKIRKGRKSLPDQTEKHYKSINNISA